MAERGSRTRIIFGGITAPVALLNTSGKPKAAQHETRRVEVAMESLNSGDGSPADSRGLSEPALPNPAAPPVDEFADGPLVARTTTLESGGAKLTIGAPSDDPGDPLGDDPAPPFDPHDFDDPAALATAATPAMVAPTRVERGVWRPTGEWVDLTDRLDAIDERTKRDGLHVVGTIPAASVPRKRIRGAQYIASDGPDAPKVMALLWRALRQSNRAAVVVWTKRTAQAVGIIVASGGLSEGSDSATLTLLECEWHENMRAPAQRVTLPLRADVSEREVVAAVELIESYSMSPKGLDELRDERNAKRAEMLALAREGKVGDYVAPAAPEGPSELERRFADALAG